MSLMAELGEGPPPAKSNSMLPSGPKHYHHHQNHHMSHQSRFNQPPPNPMVSSTCTQFVITSKSLLSGDYSNGRTYFCNSQRMQCFSRVLETLMCISQKLFCLHTTEKTLENSC